jgi:hypothetical protein
MTQGLRVWNSSGQLTLDVTDRVTRQIEAISVAIPPNTGFVDVYRPGITASSWGVFATTGNVMARVFDNVIRCYASPYYAYRQSPVTQYVTINLFRY